MSLETRTPDASFALLSNGANFSCEVLQALTRRNYRPVLLALPEYPPAPKPRQGMLTLEPQRRLLALANDIKIAYAPAARQREFAVLVEQRAIEFLLVACWPYLIDAVLIESASRAALNLHPSLLPRYRGPDPLGQQLARGDSSFGVSLHLLNRQFDRGDIVARQALTNQGSNSEVADLEYRCATIGVDLFIDHFL